MKIQPLQINCATVDDEKHCEPQAPRAKDFRTRIDSTNRNSRLPDQIREIGRTLPRIRNQEQIKKGASKG